MDAPAELMEQGAIAESAPAAVVLVDHGEARAAIAFRTDLFGDDKGVIVGRFAPESHAPIVYPVALTRACQRLPGLRRSCTHRRRGRSSPGSAIRCR